MKNLLLYGVGTFKNRGVEAIINSTLNQIDQKDFSITIASHDYDYNKGLYPDVKHVKHYYKSEALTEEERALEKHYQEIPFDYHNFEYLYQKDVVAAMKNSDICISVGGDNYCYSYCTWLYALDSLSHKLGKKTVLWGASLFEEITEDELIHDLSHFDVLVIRESLSYNAVRKWVSEEKIIFAPDPAFSLEKKTVLLNDWYQKRKIVALNFSPLTIQTEVQEKAIYDLIDYLLKETKYSILLLPHVTTEDCNDLEILNKIKKHYNGEDRIFLERGDYNCNELKYIISKCSILVAARTHASIAAYSTCVPTLVIGYSVKSKGIAKDLFGDYRNYVISKDELTSEQLKKNFLFIEEHQDEIKKTLKDKMKEYKKVSANLFQMVLDKIEIQDAKEICQASSCIGCGVCAEKCPQKAITMEEGSQHFIYPKIDLSKCIHCDVCRKVCPILNKKNHVEQSEKICYAAINQDVEEQRKSTSGGVFSILARAILQQNGIVYGACMEDFKIKHTRITSEKELDRIRGSKYVQSNIREVLGQIKTDLEKEKNVLFCGTPCQIGAVRSFLGKDVSNLILVSVICHGVISQNIFDKYRKEIEIKKNCCLDDFKFRTKAHQWTQSSIEYNIGGDTYVTPFIDDPLMQLYLSNYILRPSCYDCRYKGGANEADIILGDFWGIEVTDPEMLDQNGVSAVIVNGKKGHEFLEQIDFLRKVKYKYKKLDDITPYNPSLIKNIDCPVERSRVLQELEGNTIYLMSTHLKEQKIMKEQEEKIKVANMKVDGLIAENTKLATQLDQMLNSKRWKLVNQSVNSINKLLGRK